MAEPSAKRILDVGQCGVDGPRIGRFLTRTLGYAVDRAHSREQAVGLAAANHYDLVLVNRVLDRDRSSGLEVIAALRAADPGLKVMLVSDLEGAQVEAVKLGALRGFGKAELETAETEEIIRAAVG